MYQDQTNETNILTKLWKTVEMNDVFPLSLNYFQNTNRIITSKGYVKQGGKIRKQKVIQRSGCRKPGVSEVTGWFC